MADRPIVQPVTWATDTNYTGGPDPGTPNKVQPSVGKRAQGWEPIERPPAQHLNQLMHVTGGWTDYYKDIDWLSLQRFVNTVVTGSDVLKAYAARPHAFPTTPGPYLMAIGANGSVFYSYDNGSTWGAHPSANAAINHHKAAVWSPLANLWIIGCAASDTDEILTAPEADGTWTNRTDPVATDNDLNGIAESGSIIVMCRSAAGFLSSTNGTTWVERTHPATGKNLKSVVWTGTQFVAVGQPATAPDPATVLTSPDGMTWTDRSSTAPTGTLFNDIAYDPNAALLVAVGTETSPTNAEIFTSPDAITWTQRLSLTNGELRSIVRAGGALFAAGYDGTTNARAILAMSLDGGLSWQGQRFAGYQTNPSTVVATYAGGRIVVFGDDVSGDLHYYAGPRVAL
jgi:hypothetical protein